MIEVEKKYAMTAEEFEAFKNKVKEASTLGLITVYELNTLYAGRGLDGTEVLRVRENEGEDFCEDKEIILTHKSVCASPEGMKIRKEIEVTVDSNIYTFLEALGFVKSLQYEKKRSYGELPNFPNLCLAFDVLPFGYYLEVEEVNDNEGRDIKKFEEAFPDLTEEKYTYPDLTRFYGKNVYEKDNVRIIQAKF